MNDGMQFGYSSTGSTDPRTFTPEQMKRWKELSTTGTRALDGTVPMFFQGQTTNPTGGSADIYRLFNMNLNNKDLSDSDRAGLLREAMGGGLDSAYRNSVNLLDPTKATDPSVKSFRATEQYYRLIADRPGSKQTRSPDLLMSNAFKGITG